MVIFLCYIKNTVKIQNIEEIFIPCHARFFSCSIGQFSYGRRLRTALRWTQARLGYVSLILFNSHFLILHCGWSTLSSPQCIWVQFFCPTWQSFICVRICIDPNKYIFWFYQWMINDLMRLWDYCDQFIYDLYTAIAWSLLLSRYINTKLRLEIPKLFWSRYNLVHIID